MEPVWIIGAGLAGAEVALQLARRDIPVRLFEMKPAKRTPAQVSDHFAELVCSNSFRGAALENAVGAIKEEMRRGEGALIRFADEAQVPAGGALAVDREKFSAAVTAALHAQPNIEIVNAEVQKLPSAEEASDVVVATGPLTAESLHADIAAATGSASGLYFYDAIAPIVDADSIDYDKAFYQSRYDKGDGKDYVNCPLDEAQYEAFVTAVVEAEKTPARDFEEERFFEGCLPIEVMASRGRETLRYGCMKPVGLTDPRTERRPHAVVQLRAEDRERTAFNLVGFQTRMKWGAQKEVFRTIPGLENVEFLRMGSVHRNTYLDSPKLLDGSLRLKTRPHLIFAGQITGVEGYVESTACGLLAAWMLIAKRRGVDLPMPPHTSTLGALHGHILGLAKAPGTEKAGHVPSNIHWGLCPPPERRVGKRDKKRFYGERAVQTFEDWWAAHRELLVSHVRFLGERRSIQ